MLAGHFSRIPCPGCNKDQIFNNRKCLACGYEIANKPAVRPKSIWDAGQQKRAKQMKVRK